MKTYIPGLIIGISAATIDMYMGTGVGGSGIWGTHLWFGLACYLIGTYEAARNFSEGE